ncbi:hypothetical protein LXL04_020552 [Taraxacum kok-saghyz]
MEGLLHLQKRSKGFHLQQRSKFSAIFLLSLLRYGTRDEIMLFRCCKFVFLMMKLGCFFAVNSLAGPPPFAQGGSLIRKQGATIKTIQDFSNCKIRVIGGFPRRYSCRGIFVICTENLSIFVLPDDSAVEILGEVTGVHKAVELVLRKFLVARSVIGVFEMQVSTESPIPFRSFSDSINTGGGPGFGPNQFMPPQHQFDNFFPRADMPPPMDKQPHTAVQPQQSSVTKVSENMQIPLSYADAVIGTSSANISYIRRASGATIAIQETRGVPDEINGSASQNSAAMATPPIQFLVHSVGLSSLLSGPSAKIVLPFPVKQSQENSASTAPPPSQFPMKFSHLDIAVTRIFCCFQVLISAKEEPEASIPPAKDGLLKVHQRVIDAKHMVFIESVIVFNGLDCYTVFQVAVNWSREELPISFNTPIRYQSLRTRRTKKTFEKAKEVRRKHKVPTLCVKSERPYQSQEETEIKRGHSTNSER